MHTPHFGAGYRIPCFKGYHKIGAGYCIPYFKGTYSPRRNHGRATASRQTEKTVDTRH